MFNIITNENINTILPNTLVNGDCLEVMKYIPDKSVDLLVTDPPYRVTPRGSVGNIGGMCKKKLYNSGKVFKHNDITLIQFIPEFYRVLKNGSHCYIMSNHINLQMMLNIAIDSGFSFIKSLIWNKGNKIVSGYYMSQFEYILFFRKGKGIQINNCGTSDILNVPNKKTKNNEGNNIHDTEKPIELMQILIENSSQQNDIILDPFMGSGSTGVACVNTNRKFIGIELDLEYFNVAKERIENTIKHLTRGFKCLI